MLVTYTGFLTHYYYFIFLFYLAVIFNIWLLWRDRHIWNCVRYAVSQGIALGLAVLTYPSCLGQMFRGQRGAQATANFFDVSNTIGRVRFFVDLMDRYVFGRRFRRQRYCWGRRLTAISFLSMGSLFCSLLLQSGNCGVRCQEWLKIRRVPGRFCAITAEKMWEYVWR